MQAQEARAGGWRKFRPDGGRGRLLMPGCGEPRKGLKQESDLIDWCLLKVKNDSGKLLKQDSGSRGQREHQGASMSFGTRWSGRVAGFQVSASVTSRETQPPAAPLPPEFSPRLPGELQV